MGSIFDLDDGDFLFNFGNDTLMDSEGNMMHKLSDNMAMDMESGELHLLSGCDNSLFVDEEDY